MNKLSVKKMSSYSVSDKKEFESLVFFYKCYHGRYVENEALDYDQYFDKLISLESKSLQEEFVKNEPFECHLETKNVQFFETYEEALAYINSLGNEDGWHKMIDEFYVDDKELEFVEGDSLKLYANAYTDEEEKELSINN